MKRWETTLAILAALFASIALAEDFKTTDGKEYKNAKVNRVEPDGIVITHSFGILKIPFTELPKDVQQRFGHDPEAEAKRAAEEKRIEEQKATERAEKEKDAEADLKRSEEQFQAAERRAVQTDKNEAKGTLSGQVFVSTKGRENFKLGAVQVLLFDRNAIDTLIATLRNYADIKIEQLRPVVDAAKTARVQATAVESAASRPYLKSHYGDNDYRAYHEAREAATAATSKYFKVLSEQTSYYSGAFYFSYLRSPIQTAETDADGKFVIEVPKTGRFVIAAQAQRSIGKDTERYYWLQPVSFEGQQQLTQNLSNNNLTSTTGTSSLILTKD